MCGSRKLFFVWGSCFSLALDLNKEFRRDESLMGSGQNFIH